MDNYLNSLDILYEENVNNDDPCCNNMDNHFISHEKILCRVCGMDIDNISCLPEKSYEIKTILTMVCLLMNYYRVPI